MELRSRRLESRVGPNPTEADLWAAGGEWRVAGPGRASKQA